ncbi:MAG: DNA-processing protein DprA [Fimbriimonadales bacterium]|nr:DNA-processing protein DprA [Fimbriimonadales bacterium]
MRERFWQRLLAAELTVQRRRGLFADLGDGPFSEERLLALLSPSERQAAERASLQALERALSLGVRLLTEKELPATLRETGHAPPALFVWGDDDCLHRPTIAIVGTRNASPYGKGCALKFAQAFAEAGVTVVSGGALGIDAAAHEGALAAGGPTAAVLGTGVDVAYPAAHRPLFERIRRSGVLVSQFAVGTKALAYRFPLRNQLIAALSRAVVVIEAPAGSGAILTANAAAELGRDVFVVPGPITQPSFRGSHALVRDGAALTDHPEQVLEAVGVARPLELRSDDEEGFNAVQRRILEALRERPLPSELLAERTGLAPGELLAELTELELAGAVRRESGLFVSLVL